MLSRVEYYSKQHYMIHLPRMIKQLVPLIRHSCFSFESAHNYFKELARKQNFKNLAKSLAERCQLKECSNFGDSTEDPKSHPLFSSERKYGSVSLALEDCAIESLREKMDAFGLLPCMQLKNVYKFSQEWSDCVRRRRRFVVTDVWNHQANMECVRIYIL